MKKRLLILGAGRGQIGLIKAAKKMGMTTIVGTLPYNNPPGIALADEVCYMDIADPNEVVEKAGSLNIDGIATCCLDTGVPSLGKTVDKLGLVGLTERSAELCKDKYEMKRALLRNNVNTAKFIKVNTEMDLEKALGSLELPVIIKATDLQGSKGIYIAYNNEQAKQGLKKALKDTHKDFCIIEEFIEGREFGAQAFIYDGNVLFVLPHGDITYMANTAVPIGHYVPLNDEDLIINQAVKVTKNAIAALGLNNCAVNVDLIEKDGIVYIIELTGRVGANCLPELVSIYYGINYYEMIAALAVGEDPSKYFEKRKKVSSGLAKMIISENSEGVIKQIISPEKEHGVYETSFFKKEGDSINKFTNSNDCIGQVIVYGENLDECDKTMEQVMQEINIILE